MDGSRGGRQAYRGKRRVEYRRAPRPEKRAELVLRTLMAGTGGRAYHDREAGRQRLDEALPAVPMRLVAIGICARRCRGGGGVRASLGHATEAAA